MIENRGLVIFDLDGTLFQSLGAIVPAVRRAFREIGLPQPNENEILYFIGRPVREFHTWLGAHCAAESASRLAATIDRYELDYIGERAGLFPGALEALTEIRGFVGQMALCSNGYPAYVERVLHEHNLRRFFDRIRYPQAVGETKMLMVRELLGKLEARPGVMVGDRRDDIEAAHWNGLTAVAARYGYGSADELSTADAVVTTAAQLPGVVRSLQRKQADPHSPALGAQV